MRYIHCILGSVDIVVIVGHPLHLLSINEHLCKFTGVTAAVSQSAKVYGSLIRIAKFKQEYMTKHHQDISFVKYLEVAKIGREYCDVCLFCCYLQ